jgi:23S rRNA (uridine2552-2'-O)-methyltransferase
MAKRRWMQEHVQDPYVRRAQREGYRSRAVYKLLEIQAKDHILRPDITVVDLGAAPGGWSQFAAAIIGERGQVIALDRLPMPPLPGVHVIQGDLLDESVLEQVLERVGGRPVDLVLSDMAPNISGMRNVDQPRAMVLATTARDLAQRILAPGGDFLVKVFQGSGSEAFKQEMQRSFQRVVVRKPRASRPRSNEVYMLGLNYLV